MRPRRRGGRKDLKEQRAIMQVAPLIRACLRRYGWNLVGRHELSSEFLRFVVSLVPIRRRPKLLRTVFEGDALRREMSNVSCAFLVATNIAEALELREARTNRTKLAECIADILAETGNPRPISFLIERNPRLRELGRVLHLRHDEIDIACMLYCYNQYSAFRDFCDAHDLSGFIKLCASATGIPASRVKQIVGANGPLIANGILEPRYSGGSLPELEDECADYLAGIGDLSLAHRYCREDKRSAFDTDSFVLEPGTSEVIRSLLKTNGPCNILLYGAPGTGKTEFARAVAASVGKKAFFVHCNEQGRSRERETTDRRLPLRASVGLVSKDDSVLIVDEADSLLNTANNAFFSAGKSPDKGWLNDFLDQSPSKIIWITNHTEMAEESTLRRFSYSLPFKPFTRREREAVWQQLLSRHPYRKLIGARDIRDLATAYQVNAGGIASALQALNRIGPRENPDRKRVLGMLKELLKRHQQAIGRREGSALNVLSEQYDVSALNIGVDASSLLASINRFAGEQNTEGRNGNISVLFWGKPGTGKTEFAKYVAAESGMDLMIKRASDLTSCWAGETEKNIRTAFEEAQRGHAILFLDEADSFFINRDTAIRSWETSQTNELLTQMENFHGVLICCTNLLEHLDGAVMRRFSWKIEFKSLAPAGRIKLYEKYFAEGSALPGPQREKLRQIGELTAGDFKAVWQRLRFLDSKERNHSVVLSALNEEAKYRKGSSSEIGFPISRES